MSLNNMEVRRSIERYGLHYYEVAEAMGIHSTKLSQMMRQELSGEKKKEIIKAISQARQDRERRTAV